MKNHILQFSVLILLSTFAFFAFSSIDKDPKSNPKSKHSNFSKFDKNGFAVLELFTSQGCSSCPPADEVLSHYAKQNNPNIIALAFHVDYWNYIGWKDPFSKAQFTERQRRYVSQLNAQGNYTPQMVINGKHELVGSKKTAIDNLVTKELALKSEYFIDINNVTITKNNVVFDYTTDAAITTNTVNFALVKKKEFTSIIRGENEGLKQTSYNIVFDFKSNSLLSKSTNTSSFQFNSNWKSTDFMLVAFIQNTKTGEIIAVAKSEIK